MLTICFFCVCLFLLSLLSVNLNDCRNGCSLYFLNIHCRKLISFGLLICFYFYLKAHWRTYKTTKNRNSINCAYREAAQQKKTFRSQQWKTSKMNRKYMKKSYKNKLANKLESSSLDVSPDLQNFFVPFLSQEDFSGCYLIHDIFSFVAYGRTINKYDFFYHFTWVRTFLGVCVCVAVARILDTVATFQLTAG